MAMASRALLFNIPGKRYRRSRLSKVREHHTLMRLSSWDIYFCSRPIFLALAAASYQLHPDLNGS